MTPELWKEVIVGIVSATVTAVFTGVPAIALFWWTWQRDQERLKVQKWIPHFETVEGKWVPQTDKDGPVFYLLIRNRSLFPIHISAVGFQIGDEVISLEQARFPMKLKPNPNPLDSRVNIPDETHDPQELGSMSQMNVTFGMKDRTRLAQALKRLSDEYHETPMQLVLSDNVAALVVTESGKHFSSLPWWKVFLRRLFRSSKII